MHWPISVAVILARQLGMQQESCPCAVREAPFRAIKRFPDANKYLRRATRCEVGDLKSRLLVTRLDARMLDNF